MDMEKLKNLAISESGFIFDPEMGESYNTNKTGIFIFKLLKEGIETDKVIGEISKKYDVSKNTAEKDVLQFLETLKFYHLI